MSARPLLRIGTRGSALARAQSGAVRDALAARWPEADFRLEILRTAGDAWAQRADDAPAPDKGFFTREFEEALAAGTIDLAVHSLKDLPTDGAPGLVLAAIPERADPRDVLVARAPGGLAALPEGAVVATGSRRRVAQLLRLRPDLRTAPIRGNIDTRLRKLRETPAWSGIVLAAAGLARLGPDLSGLVVTPLTADEMLPAPGQGALALQTRADDAAARGWAAALDHAPTRAAVEAERGFLAGLGGGCQAPVGALGAVADGLLAVRGIAWLEEERAPRLGVHAGPLGEAEAVGRALARKVLEARP